MPIRIGFIPRGLAAAITAGTMLLSSWPAPSEADDEASVPHLAETRSGVTTSAALTLSSWAPATGSLLLVGVAHQSWRNLAVSVTANGLPLEKVAEVRNAQDIVTMTVFRGQGTGASSSVSIALPGNSGPATGIATEVTGVSVGSNGAVAISSLAVEDGPTRAEGDNANMLTTVQAGAGDFVMAFGTNRLRNFAVPAGEAGAVTNVAAGKSGQRVSASAWYQVDTTAGGPVTIGAMKDLTGGSGADDWAMVALAVRASAPTASSTTTSTGLTTTSVPASPTTTAPASTTTVPAITTTAPSTTTTTVLTTTTTAPPPPAPAGDPRPYAANGPWNTPISSAPTVDPLSQTYMQAIADNNLPLTSDPDQYTIPVFKFDDLTPRRTVKLSGYFSSYDSGDDSRVGYGFAPTISEVPIPANTQQSSGSDGQVVIWNPQTGVEYSFWQFGRDASGSYVATNGYRYHTTAGYNGRFADGLAGRGAGTPYLAGLVRKWEIDRGQIDHALAFAYKSPSSRFVYPASKSDGGNFGGVVDVDLPEGSRLQLNPALTEADFDSWGLSPAARVIARALQRYGMYTVDHSGSSKIYLEDRSTAGWDASITRSLVSGIPWSQFRVVR